MWKIEVVIKVEGSYSKRHEGNNISGTYSFTARLVNHLCADTPENMSRSNVITLPGNTVISNKSWYEKTITPEGRSSEREMTDKFKPEFDLSSFVLQSNQLHYHYEIKDSGEMSRRKLILPSSFGKYTKNVKGKNRRIIISATASKFFTDERDWTYNKKGGYLNHCQKVWLELKGERAVDTAL